MLLLRARGRRSFIYPCMKTHKLLFLILPIAFLIVLNACEQHATKTSTKTTKDSTIIIKHKGDTIIKEKIVVVHEETIIREEKEENKTVGKKGTHSEDPLPSWNDSDSKSRITDFVTGVTTPGSADYVPSENRIATFDNDGTLWSEKPTYFQIEFVLYRIRQLAPQHPEWKKDKLVQAALRHDLETLRKKYGAKGIVKLMAFAQAGITTGEYEKIVHKWITTAKHPITGRLYTEMIFQPMLELIRYLQENDFKVYIVSGGGIDFMRVWAEKVYGIPRQHILGSIGKLDYEKENGKPVLVKTNDIFFVNDGPGKPVAIHQIIGEKPLIAFGNSDGDLQMLEWCDANKKRSLPAYIHHTDAKREWAYDRKSQIGTLDKGLDEAAQKGWLVVDMKRDWNVIYPYEMKNMIATN